MAVCVMPSQDPVHSAIYHDPAMKEGYSSIGVDSEGSSLVDRAPVEHRSVERGSRTKRLVVAALGLLFVIGAAVAYTSASNAKTTAIDVMTLAGAASPAPFSIGRPVKVEDLPDVPRTSVFVLRLAGKNMCVTAAADGTTSLTKCGQSNAQLFKFGPWQFRSVAYGTCLARNGDNAPIDLEKCNTSVLDQAFMPKAEAMGAVAFNLVDRTGRKCLSVVDSAAPVIDLRGSACDTPKLLQSFEVLPALPA